MDARRSGTLEAWFGDRNYAFIYAHRFFFCFADAVALNFRIGWFYEQGMGIPLILLSLAAYFAASGLIAPFCYVLANRFGLRAVIGGSAALNVAAYLMLEAGSSTGLSFAAMIVSGLSCGLYYSIADVLESLYVRKSDVRGRQITFGIGMSTLGAALGAGVGGFVLASFGFAGVAVTGAVLYAAGLVPFFFMDVVYAKRPDRTVGDVARFAARSDVRAFYPAYAGGQLFFIFKYVVPLFLYIVTRDFEVLGIVLALATLVEFAFILLFGNVIDLQSRDTGFRRAFLMNAGAAAALLTLVTGPVSAFFVQSWNSLSQNLFEGAAVVPLHERLTERGYDPILFGCVLQGAYCAFEVMTLPLYALLAVYIGHAIFPVIFAASVLGIYVFWKTVPCAPIDQAVRASDAGLRSS